MHLKKKMAKRGKKPFNFDVEVLEKIGLIATFPPYWKKRSYGVNIQIGLEDGSTKRNNVNSNCLDPN